MIPILAYWDFRGLAEPIRFLLHSQGIEFEDKRYLNYDSWQNDKYKLELDFPNLPYLIDDNAKLTQSTTILRYLARKYDMAGKTKEEKIRVELAEQQIVDFRNSLIRTCFNPEFENIKGELIRSMRGQLQLFSTFMGDRKYLAGDNVTYVDFMAYETFDFYRLLLPTALNDFKNLLNFQDRIENIPSLQTYLKSPTYKRWPILGPAAIFGGKGTEPRKEQRK